MGSISSDNNNNTRAEEPTLSELAIKYGTDKQGPAKPGPNHVRHSGHKYCEHYDRHFSRFRHQDKVTILEIGVGGYEAPTKGGESLRMWKDFDWYDKSPLQEDRITIYQGSQDDPALLAKIHAEHGDFDIIVDDGSHCNEHVIASFHILWPMLKMGGIYAIEDLQTSYWKSTFGGSSTELSSSKTSMGFLKSLADCVNHAEFDIPGYQPTYLDKTITSISFYHNLAFVYKGNNDTQSNVIGENHTMPDVFHTLAKPEWAY